MITLRASWILPISAPPIRDGWVAVDADRIVALGSHADAQPESAAIDLGRAVILPGLINAHTHLELSYLRDTIRPQSSFVPWVRQVIAAQRARTDPAAPPIRAAMESAIGELWRTGTAAVGDISNTLVSVEALAATPLHGVVFHELLGFHPDDARGLVAQAIASHEALPRNTRLRVGLAAHAPYSVARELFDAIADAMREWPRLPMSVHLAESPDEVRFLRYGTGEWRRLLEDVGAWNPAWKAPGQSPIEYLADAGFIDRRTLVVHGVQATPRDLERLASIGATLVTCPRSNEYTGVSRPPIREFYRSGVSVAIGTDSLASAPDLNLFEELRTLRRIAPEVPASALLDSATRQGARALRVEGALGTIEPGRAATLLAVRIPSSTADVEEYLVNGVPREDIRWVHENIPV